MGTHTRAAAGHFHFRISFKRRGGRGGGRGGGGGTGAIVQRKYMQYMPPLPPPPTLNILRVGVRVEVAVGKEANIC